ncbi:MAG: ATP synthase F1 subunit epsilon [Candidatus Humimicrobiaceae bacterium]
MDKKKIHASIVSPEQKIFEGEVDYISVPSVEGSMGLLPGHIPIVCQLKVGIVKYKVGSKSEYVAVQKGYMEFFENDVNIITGRAIKTTEKEKEKAVKEVSRKHDIVQEISEETRKVIQAIGSLKGLKRK